MCMKAIEYDKVRIKKFAKIKIGYFVGWVEAIVQSISPKCHQSNIKFLQNAWKL